MGRPATAQVMSMSGFNCREGASMAAVWLWGVLLGVSPISCVKLFNNTIHIYRGLCRLLFVKAS
jgi:hypothetical protein